MSDKKTNHSPQHEDLVKQHQLEQHEVKEVLKFINKYAKQGGIIIAAIIIVTLAYGVMKNKQQQEAIKADLLLTKANATADYETVATEYGKTKAGQVAELALAREKFNAGAYQEAEAIYAKFANNSDPELALIAQFNQITCEEADGQLEKATSMYDAFANANKEHYLAPSALMAKARCLKESGKADEAKMIYEDLLVNDLANPWFDQINSYIKMIEGGI